MTQATIAGLLRALLDGHTHDQACLIMGIHRSTLYRALAHNTRLRDAMDMCQDLFDSDGGSHYLGPASEFADSVLAFALRYGTKIDYEGYAATIAAALYTASDTPQGQE